MLELTLAIEAGARLRGGVVRWILIAVLAFGVNGAWSGMPARQPEHRPCDPPAVKYGVVARAEHLGRSFNGTCCWAAAAVHCARLNAPHASRS
jgi:hypothetical protein